MPFVLPFRSPPILPRIPPHLCLFRHLPFLHWLAQTGWTPGRQQFSKPGHGPTYLQLRRARGSVRDSRLERRQPLSRSDRPRRHRKPVRLHKFRHRDILRLARTICALEGALDT